MTKYKFPSQFEYLDEIRSHVAREARAAGFSDQDIYALQLAADEAVTNVITHGYAGRATGSYQIDLDISAEQVTLVISDQGRAFDPQRAPMPNQTAGAEQRPPGGLGLYLIHQFMDVVRYESAAGTNRLTLIVRDRQTADGGRQTADG